MPDSLADGMCFDGVIAGSGFGGAVMAARLAPHFGAGRLALLERGREYLPGEFPGRTSDALRSIKSPVNPLGLFDFHLQPDLDILCANALGGGSTIYANVTLEPDPDVFLARHNQRPAAPAWPPGITSQALRPYFDRVRGMLAVEKYLDQSDGPQSAPADDPDLAGSVAGARAPGAPAATDYRGRSPEQRAPLPKAELLRQLATELAAHEGHTLHYAKMPLAVNFTAVADATPNAQGVLQNKCRLCGNCVTGCNHAAKNTLACNYLPLARQQGCAIHSQTELLSFGPGERPGYRYTLQLLQRQGQGPLRRFKVHTRMLVLAAGVLGSTRLLLQAGQQHGLAFSELLGHNVSGNLDLISFAYAGQAARDSCGQGAAAQPGWEVGPTICSALEFRAAGQRRFLVQDGAWPALLVQPLSWLLGLGQYLHPGQGNWRAWLRPGPGWNARGSALNRSMVWLGIGRDRASGWLRLRANGKLRVHWPQSSDTRFAHMHRVLAAFSSRIGASYVKNPRERLSWLGARAATPITVHPLGGCGMGSDVSLGVTDDCGRIFDARGQGVHPGLYVADGSLCSAALGANPSLTIAALAERAAERLVANDLKALFPP